MLYIKIFDSSHNVLDELIEFNGLKISNTLNGTPKASFTIPLMSKKATRENIKMFNHIEIFEDDEKLWGGVIAGIDYKNADIGITCFGYIFLLSKRIYRKRKTYKGTYDKVIKAMIADIEAIFPTGLSIGKFEISPLDTTRVVDAEDKILDKIKSYCDDMDYYFEVDNDRNINFYVVKGKKKPYVLQETKEYSNIISSPSISLSGSDMCNFVYGSSTLENDSSQDQQQEKEVITSLMYDIDSIGTYGLFEGSFKANDGVVRQETLDRQTLTELNKTKLPITSIDINAIDSAICPFNDVFPGDTVGLYIEKYLNYKEDVRVLEIERDITKNEYKLTVGDILYKPNVSINKKIYTR